MSKLASVSKPTASAQSSLEKTNILVVDDRQEKLMALESVLSELGQNVVVASSGKEALRKLLKQEFAVILLDVSMPIMDGFETAALIRQRQESEHTPIIFVSAINASESHASRGYSLGAVDYIFAPVDPDILRSKVNVFIDLFRKTQQVKRQGEWLRAEATRFESRLHALLNRLNVGVFRTTYDGRITEANPAFYRLLGLERSTSGDPVKIQDFYHNPGERDSLIAELTAAGQTREHNVQLRRRDGQLIWVRLTKTLTIEPGKDRIIEGLLEDITERKYAEEVLVSKVAELARTNAELEQFAYVASHDLQEPLRMVSSYASLLSRQYDEQFDERGRKYISTLVESTGRMQTLIRDILALSRVGKIEAPASVDANEILNQALFNLKSSLDESGATVTSDSLPRVNCDSLLIGQVFQNLIANALKFKGAKTPQVHISSIPCATGCHFTVTDNGIGIPVEHHDKIFGIFQRLHTRAEYPGTGIGLAFCKKVIQHHGGRIWAATNPKGGSIFHFTLNEQIQQTSTLAKA
jgi:PAS domain S-box-containing protein